MRPLLVMLCLASVLTVVLAGSAAAERPMFERCRGVHSASPECAQAGVTVSECQQRPEQREASVCKGARRVVDRCMRLDVKGAGSSTCAALTLDYLSCVEQDLSPLSCQELGTVFLECMQQLGMTEKGCRADWRELVECKERGLDPELCPVTGNPRPWRVRPGEELGGPGAPA
ncbi:hypothetical protein [Nonomuraea sp. NPDC052265]|uniref:hypothetical protein n=1 Tax=Nonomuraea sp. NPDC052265 TaxID=3364374 RepID=UPI0037CA0CD0